MLRGLAAALILALCCNVPSHAQSLRGVLLPAQWRPVARLHVYRHWRGSYDIMFYRSETADGSPLWMAALQLWWERDLHDVAWVSCPQVTEAAAYLAEFRDTDLDALDPAAGAAISDSGALGLSFPHGPGAEVSYYQPCCTDSRFSAWASRTADALAVCFGPWRGYMP